MAEVHHLDSFKIIEAVRDSWQEVSRDCGIAVECCPTSNLLTTIIRRMADHPLPLPRFLDAGICATLNTDDPALMGNLQLGEEYRHAREETRTV